MNHRLLATLLMLTSAASGACDDLASPPAAGDDASSVDAEPDHAEDAAALDGEAPQRDASQAETEEGGATSDAASALDARSEGPVDAGLVSDDAGAADAGQQPDAGKRDAGDGESRDGGCPLALEGFATLDADGQNGTFGGRSGATVTVTTQAELTRYAIAVEPYVIRVQGAITLTPKGTEIRVASNKTIVGVGTTGAIVQGGFMLEPGVHNVILRNLTIRGAFVEGDWEGKTNDFDAVQMDTAHHVWIDHCHFHHMGDGLIDSRKDTTYLTVSWSVFSDHNKTFGIGWTDDVSAQITIHHNLFRDVNQRVPSVDNVLRAHLYNNRLLRVTGYGNYARGGTNMVLENSVFERVVDPHYGDTGSLVATGNLYRDTTGMRETIGAAFFDPRSLYAYKLDPADKVEALLDRCAGPQAGIGP